MKVIAIYQYLVITIYGIEALFIIRYLIYLKFPVSWYRYLLWPRYYYPPTGSDIDTWPHWLQYCYLSDNAYSSYSLLTVLPDYSMLYTDIDYICVWYNRWLFVSVTWLMTVSDTCHSVLWSIYGCYWLLTDSMAYCIIRGPIPTDTVMTLNLMILTINYLFWRAHICRDIDPWYYLPVMMMAEQIYSDTGIII